ncbi:uncharacterized protein EDB93DRAFT_73643 [Suillus bovinus]|uniref:uncharacterized protein n=1 Tax=Suillus bovinus TaxID=48563 RepID=UPI001B86722B|nr:uncharacterized protein EDB93DRAFT_73643 [Suillus bovinus]KAG2130796.1 hypothetical protein EDB93DRAFT_73643 [Suillus bovinus]
MEYSTADIAAAMSLQSTKYIHMSVATFLIYDYACCVHEEWRFLLQSRWTKMKGGFTPNDNADKCRALDHVELGLDLVLILFSEWFFILRTYVLWDNHIILLAAMLSIFLSLLGASSGIAIATTDTASYATSVIPGITGCYQTSTTYWLFIPFLLLSVLQLGLMALTLIRAMQDWRRNSNCPYDVLVKHNISYYACGLLFSVTNVFILLLLYSSYHVILYDFQFMILAILATCMHLHLWQVNQGSSSSMHIPMSDISFENVTA